MKKDILDIMKKRRSIRKYTDQRLNEEDLNKIIEAGLRECTLTCEDVISLAFTLSNPYWMRHIYKRMMRHRYENLEGFHSTR